MLIESDKLTISKIRDIYKEIKEEFHLSENLIIDFKNVDEIDLSGLQLLISLKKSCKQKNKKLELLNIKDELLYSFELSGTDTVLEV